MVVLVYWARKMEETAQCVARGGGRGKIGVKLDMWKVEVGLVSNVIIVFKHMLHSNQLI